jgi:hypothetical protein
MIRVAPRRPRHRLVVGAGPDVPTPKGLPIEPLFASPRYHPRWLPFLRRLGKASEQLAKIEFNVTLPADR